MPDFLSDEWITALALACEESPEHPPVGDAPDGGRLVMEAVVRDAPGRGEVRYRIAFGASSCAVTTADTDVADVRLETDYVTAVALSRGTANAQLALADGRLRVSGDVTRLAAHAAALVRLDDLFARLRESTAYPAP